MIKNKTYFPDLFNKDQRSSEEYVLEDSFDMEVPIRKKTKTAQKTIEIIDSSSGDEDDVMIIEPSQPYVLEGPKLLNKPSVKKKKTGVRDESSDGSWLFCQEIEPISVPASRCLFDIGLKHNSPKEKCVSDSFPKSKTTNSSGVSKNNLKKTGEDKVINLEKTNNNSNNSENMVRAARKSVANTIWEMKESFNYKTPTLKSKSQQLVNKNSNDLKKFKPTPNIRLFQDLSQQNLFEFISKELNDSKNEDEKPQNEIPEFVEQESKNSIIEKYTQRNRLRPEIPLKLHETFELVERLPANPEIGPRNYKLFL